MLGSVAGNLTYLEVSSSSMSDRTCIVLGFIKP
jgi:hypothetical protein